MATPPDGFVHHLELDEIHALIVAAAADGGAVGITTALCGAVGFGKTSTAPSWTSACRRWPTPTSGPRS